MRLALAVASSVNERVDERMRAARQMASVYRDLAASIRGLLETLEQDLQVNEECDIEDLANFRACAFEVMEMLPGTMDQFRRFRAEHGILVEADVAATLEAFDSWLQKFPEMIAAPWSKALARLDRDIAEQAGEVAEIASEWGAVDGDGFERAHP